MCELKHDSPGEWTITGRQYIAPAYCRLTFHAPAIANQALPGQFVMAFMPSGGKHMLPRPFSIFSADRGRGEVSLFFMVKGPGTELMAGLDRGDCLKLMGPLGKGFPALPKNALLVAGGIGIAPLAFLAASAVRPGLLIYGARTAEHLVCPPDELKLPGLTVVETTEDGSRGYKGTASDLAGRFLPGKEALFACGPVQMLVELNKIRLQAGIPAWFSMEERMACGIGACLGCVVETACGYRRVCRDGPVFPAGEVFFK